MARSNRPRCECGAFESGLAVVIKAEGCVPVRVCFLHPTRKRQGFIATLAGKDELGSGGNRILLEERLEGDELSFIILTMGRVTRRWYRRAIQARVRW